jgi:Na+:H+ antiporter, NhaA family
VETALSHPRHIRSPRAGRFFPPLGQEYVSVEALSALALFVMAAAALVWTNIDATSYADTWTQPLTLGFGDASIRLDLQHWVGDGLMTVFFFVVGVEIKRELIDGELRDPRTAAVPVAAAIGGMVVPALLFFALNAGIESARGWGIPMATDIAFAIGLLTLLGSRVPTGAKVFLLTLAIVDDLGAILVIVLFYSHGVDGVWLAAAIGVIVAIVVLRRLGVMAPLAYLVPAGVLWVCMHESGVHATLAGVVLAMLTPGARGSAEGPLERVERVLHPFSSFIVVPLFALASAGVVVDGATFDRAFKSPIAGGVAIGLLIGKPLGIIGATALALRTRRARLPAGMHLRDVAGIGVIAGVGFTVSLFIANLSFGGARLEEAKLAILVASLVAGTLGAAVFLVARALARRRGSEREEAPPEGRL